MTERGENIFFIIAIFSKNTEVRLCMNFLHKWRKKTLDRIHTQINAYTVVYIPILGNSVVHGREERKSSKSKMRDLYFQ